MKRKFILYLMFLALNKNFYSLKVKSFFKSSKDITDRRESLVKINFFDIKHHLANNHLKLRANLLRQEPYNNGTILRLGIPFKLGLKNVFVGFKGARDDYFLTIGNSFIDTNFRVYFKTVFENKQKNIRYGFKNYIAHENLDDLKFSFIETYFKHLYKNDKKNFKFKTKLKAGIKEYYKAEKPIKFITQFNKFEELQEIEKMFKIKNKKYGKHFFKLLLTQRYRLIDKIYLGIKERLDYSIISINPISKIFVELSPFAQLKYELLKNLILSHKLQFIFSQGFSVLNNSVYILFETKLNYKF